MSRFIPYGTRTIRFQAECPICRSDERDRIEILFWKANIDLLTDKIKFLHFAPEICQYKFFEKIIPFDNYVTVDIDPNMQFVKQKEDITNLSFEDNTFDYIVCNQVLEHVGNDNIAIKELSRVLKENGFCIITVPIDEKNPTLENDSINTDALRIKHYGEANHVRQYGNDFVSILLKNGLKAKKIFASEIINKGLENYGLKPNEYFWYCKKIL